MCGEIKPQVKRTKSSFLNGTSFSCIHALNELHVKNERSILRGLTKTLIDFCFLPGTSNGAEILWLYSMQWKKRFTLITVALISFAFSHIPMVETLTKNINGPENTM
jgi:hypothetical protein